jgi:hypothetical protein
VEINTEKETKIMAFRGMEPIGGMISINGGILEQIDTFNYLIYNICITHEEERV